jgi:hypothetical protein
VGPRLVERCLACEVERSEPLVGLGFRMTDTQNQCQEMVEMPWTALGLKARRAAGLECGSA